MLAARMKNAGSAGDGTAKSRWAKLKVSPQYGRFGPVLLALRSFEGRRRGGDVLELQEDGK